MESGSEIKIKYNKNIYKKTAIAEALQEYKIYLKGSMDDDSSYITVTFENINEESADDFEELTDEFSNYVLAASISI